MGPRDPMSYKAHERGEENDEHDDASLTRMFINPPLADLVSVSPPRSSLEHRTRAEMRKKENESKQKRVQNRLIGTLTIVCCFMGVVVLIRMQEFSNREESWDDMFPQTTVLLENAVSQENEDLSVFVEKLEIEERRVKHTMQKKKGYVNMHKKKGFQKSSNWSIDGPPVQLPDGVTIKSRNEKSMKVSASRRGPGQSTQPQAQRKVEYAAVESTASAKSKIIPTIHASDALQCRESVRNFVINATDGKDECDGLIKAFDKTCSNDEETPSTRRRRILHGDRRRSRRLWEKWNISFTSRLHALMYRSVQVLYDIIHYFSRFFRSSYYDADFFFAEDEVFKYFHEGLYLVDNGLDKLVQCDARRYMNKRQADLYERVDIEKQEQRRRLSSGDETLDITAPDKPKSSGGSNMLLPIKGQHASDKLVQDAFLLQQVDNIMQAINDTMNENEVAKDDAAKSKQAITDTVDVLSAVFNDPTSVEAMACCTSILNVFHELCSTDVEEQVSDTRLFFLVFVMACCGVIKSLIRYFRILWLPEAAGCILVGVISGYIVDFFPHHDVSFDGNWFLRIMVPPIIFEAALSIDKRSFNRHIVPIIIFAVVGTLVATLLTAMIVHYGTTALSGWCAPIPYVEALTFGALISSIDPIAVLSVLNNMGMSDTDTIYVLIFGESLLNDGVAIVLFHTLVHFLDETLIIDQEAILAAAVHFFVVAFGSLLVGIASGLMSTVFFWLFHGCQTPLVEVLMFLCWALLPYYVCDGIGWSGIVAAVAVGFVMDLHIVGQYAGGVDESNVMMDMSENTAMSSESNEPKQRGRRRIFTSYGLLSVEARAHVGFVTELIATAMETAIFAYLGFFLFSHRYHWNFFHVAMAIIACCVSRAVMIPSLSWLANSVTRIQQNRAACRATVLTGTHKKTSTSAGVIVDKKMQIALWFAGLRGAMSFALVEHIPMYDSFSGEGTRLKPELKAMTSASIMFTVFVLGGYTYYMMQSLGIAPTNVRSASSNGHEMTGLLTKGHESESEEEEIDDSPLDSFEMPVSSVLSPAKATAFRRQRTLDPLVTI